MCWRMVLFDGPKDVSGRPGGQSLPACKISLLFRQDNAVSRTAFVPFVDLIDLRALPCGFRDLKAMAFECWISLLVRFQLYGAM